MLVYLVHWRILQYQFGKLASLFNMHFLNVFHLFLIFYSILYILIGDIKILGEPHIGMVFFYYDLLNEALSILVLYHGSYLSETFWETAHHL